MKKNLKIAIIVLSVASILFFIVGIIQEEKNAPEETPKKVEEKSLLGSTPAETVQNYIAKKEGVNVNAVQVISDEAKNWPNSCLGLANEGEICAQVIIAGREIKAVANGKAFVYRTNTDGTIVREEK